MPAPLIPTRPAIWTMLLVTAGCAAPPPAPDPPGRFVEADGRRLFVRQSGSGPDVVLLHGLGDSSTGWQFIEPALAAAGYRVTVWDALGAGRSDNRWDADYSLEAHAERLQEVLDRLEVGRAVVVGHSLGGSEALCFAQRHPERVSALALLNPAAYREGALDGRWFWTVPFLAEIVLGVAPNDAVVRYGLGRNFHDPLRITPEIENAYVQEAAVIRFRLPVDRLPAAWLDVIAEHAAAGGETACRRVGRLRLELEGTQPPVRYVDFSPPWRVFEAHWGWY